ncbi:MAG TPA: chemotaxis protein CheW [Ignavibacteriaceae bacterium]|nr:chemotaxis protein CheW [Ignavibacteriaceae bacterium]
MGDIINFIQKIPGIVIFIIDSKEYCISIQNLREIINPIEAENKVDWEKAYINFENKIYKFFNNKKYFNSNSSKYSRILLVDFGNKRFGILVDKVIEYITFDDMFIMNSITFDKSDKKFITLNLNYQGRTIYFPDYDEIVKDFNHSETFIY